MPCRCVPAVDIEIYRQPESKEGMQAQAYFNRRGVAYDDYNVTADLQAFARMKDLSGQAERPVIVVNDRVFIGYDPEQLDLVVPSMHY